MPLDVLGRTRATLINPTSTTNPRLSVSGGVSAVNAVGALSGAGSSAPGPIGLGNL